LASAEKLQPERLLQGTEDVKSIPVDSASIVSLQDEKHVGFKSMVDDILQVAERHLAKLNQRQRKPARLQSWWSACSAAAATPSPA
jgi:galactarate dehydratase